MRARTEPRAAAQDMDIPMPAMSPAWRVTPQGKPAMDPATRRLAIFAGLIGGALVLLVGVWSFTGHRHAGVPVIEADSRPLRSKPADPGGMKVDGANESILSGEADGTAAMAPPPEIPAPQELKAEEQKPASPAPPPVAVVPPEPPKPVVAAEEKPALPIPPAPKPEAVASIAKPAPVPSQLGMAARPAAVAATGASIVQLAAVDSEPAAKAEWQRLAHKYGDLLDGRSPTISKIEHAGKIFWRVRTGGFGDVAQAEQFCARVKAKGGGCSVAGF